MNLYFFKTFKTKVLEYLLVFVKANRGKKFWKISIERLGSFLTFSEENLGICLNVLFIMYFMYSFSRYYGEFSIFMLSTKLYSVLQWLFNYKNNYFEMRRMFFSLFSPRPSLFLLKASIRIFSFLYFDFHLVFFFLSKKFPVYSGTYVNRNLFCGFLIVHQNLENLVRFYL